MALIDRDFDSVSSVDGEIRLSQAQEEMRRFYGVIERFARVAPYRFDGLSKVARTIALLGLTSASPLIAGLKRVGRGVGEKIKGEYDPRVQPLSPDASGYEAIYNLEGPKGLAGRGGVWERMLGVVDKLGGREKESDQAGFLLSVMTNKLVELTRRVPLQRPVWNNAGEIAQFVGTGPIKELYDHGGAHATARILLPNKDGVMGYRDECFGDLQKWSLDQPGMWDRLFGKGSGSTTERRWKNIESWYDNQNKPPALVFGLGEDAKKTLDSLRDSRVPVQVALVRKQGESAATWQMNLHCSHALVGAAANTYITEVLKGAHTEEHKGKAKEQSGLSGIKFDEAKMYSVNPVDRPFWLAMFEDQVGVRELMKKIDKNNQLGPVSETSKLPIEITKMLDKLRAFSKQKYATDPSANPVETNPKMLTLAAAIEGGAFMSVAPSDPEKALTDLGQEPTGQRIGILLREMLARRIKEKGKVGQPTVLESQADYLNETMGALLPESEIGQELIGVENIPVFKYFGQLSKQLIASVKGSLKIMEDDGPDLTRIAMLQNIVDGIRDGLRAPETQYQVTKNTFYLDNLNALREGIREAQAGRAAINEGARVANGAREEGEGLSALVDKYLSLVATGSTRVRHISALPDQANSKYNRDYQVWEDMVISDVFTTAHSAFVTDSNALVTLRGETLLTKSYNLMNPIDWIEHSLQYFVNNPIQMDKLLWYLTSREQIKGANWSPAKKDVLELIKDVKEKRSSLANLGLVDAEIIMRLPRKWVTVKGKYGLKQLLAEGAAKSTDDRDAAEGISNAFLELLAGYVDSKSENLDVAPGGDLRFSFMREMKRKGIEVDWKRDWVTYVEWKKNRDDSALVKDMKLGEWLIETLPLTIEKRQLELISHFGQLAWWLIPPELASDPDAIKLHQFLVDTDSKLEGIKRRLKMQY